VVGVCLGGCWSLCVWGCFCVGCLLRGLCGFFLCVGVCRLGFCGCGWGVGEGLGAWLCLCLLFVGGWVYFGVGGWLFYGGGVGFGWVGGIFVVCSAVGGVGVVVLKVVRG